MSIRNLYYKLPPSARFLSRKLLYIPQDILHAFGPNAKKYPAPSLIYTGGGNFRETGFRFVEYFKKHGDLKPNEDVLDIGCGIGRMAIPLTEYLDKGARYDGFDVIPMGIKWCNGFIAKQHQNFKFHLIDLKNDLYRNDGEDAANFTFPLKAESKDFIFLISVMTHLQKEEMENYLKEIYRLLRPGKTCFSTFFVLDEKLKEVNPNFSFKFKYEDFSLMDQKVKSANIAFQKAFLFKLLEEVGFSKIQYFPGYWRNPEKDSEALDFQDILIFQK